MKKSYVPSPYTLSVLDNYGCKPFGSRLAKTKTSEHLNSESKIIVRNNSHAFDKQNLLEQLRLQKKKINMMSTLNLKLHQTLDKTRVKMSVQKPQPRREVKTGYIASSLKRQVELLVEQLEKQEAQIKSIKTSKKYNRFEELKKLKEVYQEETQAVKSKIRGFNHAMRERRRLFTSHKNRERGMRNMNKAVQHQITLQNESLLDQIQNLKAKIQMDQLKKASLKRDKERILKDIFQLQKKTGKLYVIKEQSVKEAPDELQKEEEISKLEQKYVSQKQTRLLEENQDYSEQYEQDEDEFDQDGNQQQEEEQEEQSNLRSSLSQKNKRLNISY